MDELYRYQISRHIFLRKVGTTREVGVDLMCRFTTFRNGPNN